jgi:hypothetical protein
LPSAWVKSVAARLCFPPRHKAVTPLNELTRMPAEQAVAQRESQARSECLRSSADVCRSVQGNLLSELFVSLGRPPTKQIPCKREFVLSTFFTVRVGEMIQHQCFGVSAWCKVGACPGRIASATSAAKVIGSVSPEAVVLCLQLYST